MIHFQSVTFAYNGETSSILADVTLTVAPGEHVVLVGPNGCGKTTLLKHMNALLLPTTGACSVDGMSTGDRRLTPEIRHRVGMVFQNADHQIVGMTVEEDVAFGPGNLGLPSREIRQRVDAALAVVGLTPLAQRPPHTLSGGEKRLLAIAGTLAMEPRYLVLDEPTAHLDDIGRRRVIKVLDRLLAGGIAIIHVTHDLDDILRADRLLAMAGGKIRHDGPPQEILGRQCSLAALGLEAPAVSLLMDRLREEGYPLPAGVLTIEQGARALRALLDGHTAAGNGPERGSR